MKKLLIIALLFIFQSGIAQTEDRIMISGKITVPIADDPEGINVVNTTTRQGSVSDANGDFALLMKLGDIIQFSALQFQEFTVIVDKNVMDSGQLNVFISESATELPEVVISPIDLSGNVRIDVQRIPDRTSTIPVITQGDLHNASLEFRPGEMDSPENAAMRDSFMKNGLNFVNVFKALLASRERGNKELEPLGEQVRAVYDDDFFREYLKVERSQISDFILYAEEKGLNDKLLEEGNELELVEFLIFQSKAFKKENLSD